MQRTLERERNLDGPPRFSLARLKPRLKGYVAADAERQRLHTVYYDSDDVLLMRWGASLRFRHNEGWTLKLPKRDASTPPSCEEYVFAGTPDIVPPAALNLATAYLRGAPVKPVAELRTLRTSRRVRTEEGDELAEVVEDDVRVMNGSRVVRRFVQVDIELTPSAGAETRDALMKILHDEGAGGPDDTPKNVRAMGDREREPELAPRAVGPSARVGDLVRATLAESVEQFIRLDAQLRLGPDPDALHEARVAIRRLRSNLRTFLPLLDRTWACTLREKLRWIGDGLAAARDADVLLARLEQSASLLPGADRRVAQSALVGFEAERKAAYVRVATMLHDQRYVALLDELIEAAKRPNIARCERKHASNVITTIVEPAWKKLRTSVRARSRPPTDRELHRIRIAAKRLRYAAEAVEPVAGKAARAFARKVERLQTILGDQHDAVVALRALRARLHDGRAGFFGGEFAMLESQAADSARRAWRKRWRTVARKRNFFWRAH